jgi:YVTN family beta-propeller protein
MPVRTSIIPQVIALILFLILFDNRSGEGGAPNRERLYVVSESSNTLSVFDGTDFRELATLATGYHPRDVTVDPFGRYIYVASLFTKASDDVVDVFDAATHAIIATLIAGHQPTEVVSNHAGNLLYVTSEASPRLSRFSVPGFKALEGLKLGGKGAHGAAISPDDRYLLVANRHSGDISLIDNADQTISRIPLPGGASPGAVGFGEDHLTAYVSDAGLNRVYQIDIPNRRVAGFLPVAAGPASVGVAPNRPVLYIPCFDADAVYKIDSAHWKISNILRIGKGPKGIAFSGDGRTAYLSLLGEESGGKIVLLDTETDQIRETFPAAPLPVALALWPGKNRGW